MLLREKDKRTVIELAQRTFNPPVEILAYGSRVRGDAHETSDLDLALRRMDGKAIPLQQMVAFRRALQESNLPILVDVMDWAQMPEAFRRQAQSCHQVLYKPGERYKPGESVS